MKNTLSYYLRQFGFTALYITDARESFSPIAHNYDLSI